MRGTIIKFGAFLALTAALVLFIGARFLGLFTFFGEPDYQVRMPLGDAAGLFERSEVTYRGVPVGEVGPLELSQAGVTAVLVLRGGGPQIPADLTAVIASRSAVGEKYVDLRPDSDRGPALQDGATIPADRVRTPIPVQDVLSDLDSLAASVPLDDLRTTVRELGVAFNGLGPKLQLALDSTHELTRTASDTLPETLKLIKDARTVLNTQNDLSDPIRSFTSDLELVTQELKDDDPDIRRLLDDGPDAAHEISALLDESGEGLGDTIEESLTLSQVTRDHLRDIQSVLQLYPGLAAAIPTLLPEVNGDVRARLGLVVNINDPPVCSRGYEATVDQPGYVTTPPDPINYRAYCREPIFSPTDVRGIKPQYPFVNGRPQPPPDWFHAFYTDGAQAGIFGPPARSRDGGHRHGHDTPVTTLDDSTLPGLLNAPGIQGRFGLVPSVLEDK